MVRISTYEEAIADARARTDDLTILLGNGFSMAFDHSIFAYESLADEAVLSGLSVDKAQLFDDLGSSNFEVVIEMLRAAASLQELYGGDRDLARRQTKDARIIRNGLADVLAERHPDSAGRLSDDEVRHARTFLHPFRKIFSLNYDLLLYWVVNRELIDAPWVPKRDGFEWPTGTDKSRLIWKPKPTYSQQVFFLHGALHLFVEEHRLTKLKFGYTGTLVDALRARLNAGEYPLVITEGNRAEKEVRIEKSAYLRTGLKRFGEVEGALFVHGVSMSRNDGHILEAIESESSGIEIVYVGVHGDPNSDRAKALIERANDLKSRRRAAGGRRLRVRFYDAESAHVWRD
jgi:hypothetical protein